MSSEATPEAAAAQDPQQPSHALKGPGFPASDEEVTCPSCGRFAGTYERCPFCGADMKVRFSVKALRRLSVVVALGGLLMTWWAAKNMEVPLRKVGDFSPTMNFAILRVHGEIVAGPYYGDRGDSFYVGIDDGSGRINVKAYGKMSSVLQAMELGRGDRVEARGSIRLQAGKPPAMSLRIPEDLKLLSRAQAPAPARKDEVVEVSTLTREMAGERVRVHVRGVLSGFRENTAGREVTLRDASGKIKVWVYQNDLEGLGSGKDLLVDGKFVEIVGRLDLYRKRGGEGVIQLRPFKAPDSVVEAEGTPPELPEETSPPPASSPRPRPTPAPTPAEVVPAPPPAPPTAEVLPENPPAPEEAPQVPDQEDQLSVPPEPAPPASQAPAPVEDVAVPAPEQETEP